MQSNRREELLKIGAVVGVALLLLNYVVINPALDHWKDQSDAITALRSKVNRGKQLIARERAVRDRWAEMQRTQMPDDITESGNQIWDALNRWAQASGVMITNVNPSMRPHPEGYDTYDWQVNATSDQASLGHLIHEVEIDPLPARMEDCIIAAKDNKGQQLNLTLKFSYVHIGNTTKITR
ncbi:MAG TPA: hypothetical protein VGH90_08185 [Chthoniobacteraceae bacterium]